MTSPILEKLGFWSKDKQNQWGQNKDWIWFHAVSVGEINAVWTLLLKINERRPELPIMISCTTKAGYLQATTLNKFKKFLVFYFPFDFPWTINSFLNMVKVKLIIIVETEIWPTLLFSCKKRNIPVILVNARLSDKSFKNYHLFRFFFKKVLNCFSRILSQSEDNSAKFLKLGISKNKIKTLGNIKFSNTNETPPPVNILKTAQSNNIKKLIFASTHKGEEELAIKTFKKLIENNKNIRLMIAPRHLNRVNEIMETIKQYGFLPILKTEQKILESEKDIFILDTIGELNSYLKLADITVMGGTFAKIGGHNILEPIREGSYTIIGPYDFKITHLSKTFKSKNAIVQVNNLNELIEKINIALKDELHRKEIVYNGQKIIKENSNTINDTVNEIIEFL